MSATPPLVANAITVTIDDAPILTNVSHSFAPGRVTALLGPNGAGKSTLIACLAGLRVPQTGTAHLGDTPVTQMDRAARGRAIGFLPQVADVHWDVDVETLVRLGRFPHARGWGQSHADRTAITNAMALTDTARFASRVVNTLSGGERSRVLLARVLAGEPQWLLADEPLASLDPAHQIDVLRLLRSVAERGAGVIVVMHDLSQAIRLADDAVLLKSGQLIASGPATDVLTPTNIATAYGVHAEIGTTTDGLPFIVPLDKAPA